MSTSVEAYSMQLGQDSTSFFLSSDRHKPSGAFLNHDQSGKSNKG